MAREVRVRAGGRHGRGAAQVPGRGRAQQEETAAANIGLERNYVSCWPPHKNCLLRYLDIDRYVSCLHSSRYSLHTPTCQQFNYIYIIITFYTYTSLPYFGVKLRKK